MKKTLKAIACQMAILGAVSMAVGLTQATVSQANQSLFASSTSNGTTNDILINSLWYSIVDRSRGGDTFIGGTFGYTGADFTGYYIGTIFDIGEALGNPVKANTTSDADMVNLISYYLNKSNLEFDFETIDSPKVTGTKLELTYEPGNKSGIWKTTGGTPSPAVSFYAIKGSNEFALYWVNPALDSGNWITGHLSTNNGNIPEISHITVSLVPPGDDPPEVPEPAAMLLFGTGLAGLAGAARRKQK